MSFRKRSLVVSSPGQKLSVTDGSQNATSPGVRPSPLDGRLTTSSGTRSLDALLGGHAGLPLGTSILIEESGTTDFSGILLRYFAAEGVVQGHVVHAMGLQEGWGRELPGVTDFVARLPGSTNEAYMSNDRMKIAWRYERLGEFGRDRNATPTVAATSEKLTQISIFCHEFDLSKRLQVPSPTLLKYIPVITQRQLGQTETARTAFSGFLQHLTSQLAAAGETVVHRVVIPTIMSPTIYPHCASNPEDVLQFLHAVRALLRKYPTQLVVLITLPLSLYPRATGLTRWIELLSDGVVELAPFPAQSAPAISSSISGSATSQEDPPQGMLKVHRIPVFHEKGGGGGEYTSQEDDLAFTLSKRKGLVIKPFSLPPVDGEGQAQSGILEKKAAKIDMEF